MENVTIVGMKEMNQRIIKIERNLNDISKSLDQIAKILDRQVPLIRTTLRDIENLEDEEED